MNLPGRLIRELRLRAPVGAQEVSRKQEGSSDGGESTGQGSIGVALIME
jgi:hypothetical protein